MLISAAGFWSHTGYAGQARRLLATLPEHGHEVAQLAWYGLRGGLIDTGRFPVYPAFRDGYGNDIAPYHVREFQADLLLTHMDVWVLDPDLETRCGVPILAYFPVDHEPVGEVILSRARRYSYPTVYSHFAAAQMQAAGVDCAYVPHGIDVEVFSPGAKAAARTAIGFPQETFLCTMVAANNDPDDRKAFVQQVQAFAAFRQQHPEAMLYLHTFKQNADGLDLIALVQALGLPEASVRFADQYHQILGLPDGYLADVYRASDVLLGASRAEGFGLPLAEAQACGCPVVTTNFSAMPELTVNGLTTAPAARMWVALYRGWQALPSVEAITDALEQVYAWPTAEREARARAGVRTMRATYGWDVVMARHWLPLLARIARERGLDAPRPALVEVGA